jgi:c-di-GMP phosphodiesterase
VGYELLSRGAGHADAVVGDPDRATGEVILAALADIGLDALTGGKRAFINVTREFLLSERVTLLPPDRVGLEVLESVRVDEVLVERLRDLRGEGYYLVLDDYVCTPETRPLLDVAHMVKVDVLELGDEQIKAALEPLRGVDVAVLAEKISDRAAYHRCVEHGFEYYQGYVFGLPDAVPAARTGRSDRATVSLLAELQRPDSTLGDLTDAISRDPATSFQLLRYVNSAAIALRWRITSIHDAVVLLGQCQVRDFATLVVLAGTVPHATELTRIAAERAKLLELTARRLGRPDPDAHFTVGLLSVLPDMFQMPMDAVLADIPVHPDIALALLRREGPYGDALTSILHHELGVADPLTGAALPPVIYAQAAAWADATAATLTHRPPPASFRRTAAA